MRPPQDLLTYPFTSVLLTTAYLAAIGHCADDPGPVPFRYPEPTIEQLTVGDTINIARPFLSPGQHPFDFGLVLPNETTTPVIVKGVETAQATATTDADTLNFTIPDQPNNKTIQASSYPCTIHSSDSQADFDLNSSSSPVVFGGTNISCHYLVRSAAGSSSTRCTENGAVPRQVRLGSSIRTQDSAVSFAALVVALWFATVLLE